jgi:putative Mn2+ efflux pump MntP
MQSIADLSIAFDAISCALVTGTDRGIRSKSNLVFSTIFEFVIFVSCVQAPDGATLADRFGCPVPRLSATFI